METVRRPRFKIIYGGKDISMDIESYLIDVEYTDNTADTSDEVSFTVEDTFANWRGSWFPYKGDKLQLFIGYDETLLNCGTFTVDEIDMQGPPDTVSIRALAAGANSPLRTKKSKAFEGQTLRQIAEEVAKNYGYEIVDGEPNRISRKITFDSEKKELKKINGSVLSANELKDYTDISTKLTSVANKISDKGKSDAAKALKSAVSEIKTAKASSKKMSSKEKADVTKSLRSTTIDAIKEAEPDLVDYTSTKPSKATMLDSIRVIRVTQNRETDLEFLRKVASAHGIMFSLRDDKLVFTSIYAVENAKPVKTLDRTDLISYQIKSKATRIYKKVVIKYHDPKKNSVTKAEIEAGADNDDPEGAKINAEESSKDELVINERVDSQQQAEEKARAALHKANSKSQEGSITVPGDPLLVAGSNFVLTGMGMLSGKFTITKSSHRIGRDGYTTDLEIKKIAGPVTVGKKFEIGDVLFDFDSDVIKSAGYAEINKIIAFMRENVETVIEVAGHTDNVGDSEYNEDLSNRRANVVMDYMITSGILATRLEAKGYGETKPVASNATSEGRQKNRRTEFTVIRNN